jgi:hypothetical protein
MEIDMKYKAAVNIWNLNEKGLQNLQIGQWVYAGNRDTMGRFYGQGRTTVVAWVGNGKGRWKEYTKAIYDYGQTVKQ